MNGQPPNTTILMTNLDGEGQVWITLPNAGTVWIALEWQQEPPSLAQIWHQGGTTTPISPGFGTYPVNPGDAIVYALANAGDSIKLGWAYV